MSLLNLVKAMLQSCEKLKEKGIKVRVHAKTG